MAPLSIISTMTGLPATPGGGALAFVVEGTADSWGGISCDLPLLPSDMGRTLTVTAWIMAPEPNHLFVSVVGMIGATKHELLRVACPASRDMWKELKVRTQIPDDLDSDSIRLVFSIRNQPGVVCAIDDVRARIDDA